MIPKVIHYCWFGGNPLPELAVKCIESWRKLLPDYEIKEWNESNFDVHCCRYVEEAYNTKKWAFVADYARFLALYKEGGLYFDTDIEVLKPFDDLLSYNVVFGFGMHGTSLSLPVFLAAPGQKCFADILDYYAQKTFINHDGSLNTTTIEITAANVLTKSYGLQLNGERQLLEGDIAILPSECFGSTDWRTGVVSKNPNLYIIHYADGSWLPDDVRQYILTARPYRRIFGYKIGSQIGAFVNYTKTKGIIYALKKVFSK